MGKVERDEGGRGMEGESRERRGARRKGEGEDEGKGPGEMGEGE